MHFMIIERFRGSEAVAAVYERFAERGRLMPEGLKYVNSWIEPNFNRSFLVAECEDLRMIQRWVLQWNDLIEFDVIPVVPSKETAEVVTVHLEAVAAKSAKTQGRTRRLSPTRRKRHAS
jgi:hypothetical protein